MKPSIPITFFCIAELIGALGSFSWTGSCQIKFGKACNDAETVYNDYNALWKLQVAVLLSALALTMDNVETYSRSSFVWLVTMIALANFCGVMMFGSFMVDGLMPTAFHFCSMLYSCFTFAALYYAAVTNARNLNHEMLTKKEAASTNHRVKNSTKIYLMVIATYYILWVFLNSDGSECTEVIHNKEEFTSLAAAHWNYWSVGTLESAIIFIWAALSNDTTLRMATCKAVALMQIPSLSVAYYLHPITTFDIQCKTTTSFVLMLVFAIWAVMKEDASQGSKTKAG